VNIRYNIDMSDMSRHVEAVYENGVLRPLQPLDLRDHERAIASVFEAAHPPARSALAVEYIERIKREVQDEQPAPGSEEVRRRLSKISGSMAAEIIAQIPAQMRSKSLV
jgi:predicted DNA-binding antitoxin AbrB/MazE fold protein